MGKDKHAEHVSKASVPRGEEGKHLSTSGLVAISLRRCPACDT